MYDRLMRGLSRRAGFRLFRLFSRPIEPGRRPMVRLQLRLRLADEDEALALCDDAELELSPTSVRAAHARGDLCVGAFDGAFLAGYCWLAFTPVPHLDGVWVDFDPEAAWTYKSFVRPAYRGRGIASALYGCIDELCTPRGKRTSLICVESHNRPSVGAARRAGYASAGYAGYLRRRTTLFAGFWPPGLRKAVRFYVP